MKPFFSIRIEWNPADSDEESHRDCFTAKRSVARQIAPHPKWVADQEKLKDKFRDDTASVVRAITRCIEDLGREANWKLPDLVADIVFDLANGQVLEEQVLALAGIALDGCEGEFLDRLQKMIDGERAKANPEPDA